jgi:hypothetical protein
MSSRTGGRIPLQRSGQALDTGKDVIQEGLFPIDHLGHRELLGWCETRGIAA